MTQEQIQALIDDNKALILSRYQNEPYEAMRIMLEQLILVSQLYGMEREARENQIYLQKVLN